MRVVNKTGKVVSFSVPIEVGPYNRKVAKWYHVPKDAIIELDDDVVWRAEAHELTALKDGEDVAVMDKIDVPFDFTIIKGIGTDLGIVFTEKFKTLDNLKKATLEDLIKISGINELKAQKIMKQLENL